MKIFKLFKTLLSKEGKKYNKYTSTEESLLEVVKRCQNLMANNSLGIVEARQFMLQLPTHYYKKGKYKDEIHTICNTCHKELWKYCKKKELIDDIDYNEFTKHGMIHFKKP